MHTHPFLQKYSSLNKTTLFWISHAEWWEEETSFSNLLFIWGSQKWGSLVPLDISTYIPKVCCRIFSWPRDTPKQAAVPLPALCAQRRGRTPVEWLTGLSHLAGEWFLSQAGSSTPPALPTPPSTQVKITTPSCNPDTKLTWECRASQGLWSWVCGLTHPWVLQVVPSFTALSLALKPPTDCLCLFNSSLPQELQLLPETPGMSLVPPLQILRRPSGQEHKADSKAKLTALAKPCFLHFWLCQKCYWEPVK